MTTSALPFFQQLDLEAQQRARIEELRQQGDTIYFGPARTYNYGHQHELMDIKNKYGLYSEKLIAYIESVGWEDDFESKEDYLFYRFNPKCCHVFIKSFITSQANQKAIQLVQWYKFKMFLGNWYDIELYNEACYNTNLNVYEGDDFRSFIPEELLQ